MPCVSYQIHRVGSRQPPDPPAASRRADSRVGHGVSRPFDFVSQPDFPKPKGHIAFLSFKKLSSKLRGSLGPGDASLSATLGRGGGCRRSRTHHEERLGPSGSKTSIFSTVLFLFPFGQICKLHAAQKRIHPLLWISTSRPPNFSASDLNLATKMTIKNRENRQTP